MFRNLNFKNSKNNIFTNISPILKSNIQYLIKTNQRNIITIVKSKKNLISNKTNIKSGKNFKFFSIIQKNSNESLYKYDLIKTTKNFEKFYFLKGKNQGFFNILKYPNDAPKGLLSFNKKFFTTDQNINNKQNLNSPIKMQSQGKKNDSQIDEKSSPEQYNKDIEKSQQEYDSDTEDQVSFYNQRKRMIYIFTSSCLIFIGMYLFLNYVKPEEDVPLQKRFGQVTYVGSAKIGGPWKLYNTKGEIMTHKDFNGKYYLIYFGFTQCPDVCPMSLQKIAKALTKIRQSKEYKYFDLDCIFVSVDPDRDSYDRIKNYCELFNKNIIGLTGKSNDDPELKAMLKEFKIHSSKIYLTKEDEEIDRKNLERNVPEIVDAMKKVEPKSNMKYSLDHTIVTYLMGPNNNFITFLSANLNHEEMYNIILEGIMNDLSQKIKGAPVEKSRKN